MTTLGSEGQELLHANSSELLVAEAIEATHEQTQAARDSDQASKRAIVTGAANGIGRAIADLLMAEGFKVGAIDIDDSNGRELEFQSAGSCRFAHCDLRNAGATAAAVTGLVEWLGGLDSLVCNAGVNAYFDATTMTEEEWDDFFAVDLKSAWRCIKYALPDLVETSGSIVVISSIHAQTTMEGMFPYAAAKAALEGMVRSLCLDWGPHGVRINAVAPGATRTALVDELLDRQADPERARRDLVECLPLKRIVEASEVAELVHFLLSDRSSAITGTRIPIDCGASARGH